MEERIEKALKVAWEFGQINGSRHKMWVIDQIVRVLCGDEEKYRDWVETYETSYGEDYYVWDIGVAP